jgi:hypothetical protein
VPEYSIKFVDASYDTPTTYTTDPYTGQTVTHQSQHIVNRTIEVNIKNQQFTPYQINGSTVNFYLNIRSKGSYDKDWINIYSPDNGYITPSKSAYTTITYSLDDNTPPFWNDIKGRGSVDIQVQALVGFVHKGYDPNAMPPFIYPWMFYGEKSDWSSTQTVAVPEATATTQVPTPTAIPTAITTGNMQVNDLVIIIIAVSAVIITIVVAVAAVMISRAKKSRV